MRRAGWNKAHLRSLKLMLRDSAERCLETLLAPLSPREEALEPFRPLVGPSGDGGTGCPVIAGAQTLRLYCIGVSEGENTKIA